MKEADLKLLFEDMSLQEKIGQMMQLDISCFSSEGAITGPEVELGISTDDFFLAGSVLGAVGSEKIRNLQELCMKRQPHNIPLLFMADIINGYRTIFPIPLALGCTFDEDTVKTAGDIMARESAAAGLHITFAPMVDLVRDARWGRVMESTGEDPYLNSKLAAAMVKGIQGNSDGYKDHLGACTKHFAAYGAPVAGKEYNNVELSERSLREDYLPSYKAAVDAGTAMMMTSFNTLDRIPATGDSWLMREVLREEMGFDGVLISDWAAIDELVQHAVAETRKDASRQALEAGVDMDMMSGCYMQSLQSLVEEKAVSEKLIDEAVWRILKLKNKLGLFENPHRNASVDSEQKNIFNEDTKAKARQAAAKSIVLLENKNNFLPLDKSEDLAFIGPYVDEKNIIGAWSFFGNPQDSVSLIEGIRNKGINSAWEPGCEIMNPGETILGFKYNISSKLTKEQTEELIEKAVEMAKTKQKIIMAIGESPLQTGEGGSRADITIPFIQKKLFDEIYKVNNNIAVIIFAGRPLDIREIKQKAKAVIYAWMPGTEGGNALADILYGDFNPQAKLAMSLPYCVGQVPVFYSELRTGRFVADGDQMDNRFLTRYSDIPNSPLYPFGYGKSYTDFEISKPVLNSDSIDFDQEIQVSVTVKNIGVLAGTETVQMYITDKYASVARPMRELKGFQKINLQAGEEATVSFVINSDMLKYYDRKMIYRAERGEFTVWIGNESHTQNGVDFRLT